MKTRTLLWIGRLEIEYQPRSWTIGMGKMEIANTGWYVLHLPLLAIRWHLGDRP